MKAIASVILLTNGENCELLPVLASVFDQEYKDIEVQILSSLPIPEIPREYPVEVIGIEKASPGKILNQAFAKAEGDYLVLLDARAIPRHRRWLHRLLGHFIDEEIAAVGGWGFEPRRIVFPNTSYRLDLAGFLNNPEYGLSNVNCAYRREVWERFPFNESLPMFEEKEWAFRVLQEGYLVAMEYAAGIHYIPPEPPVGQAAFRDYWEKNQTMASFLHREVLNSWDFGAKVLRRAWDKKDPSCLRRGIKAYTLSRRLHYEMCDFSSLCKARVGFFKKLDFLQHP